MPPRNAANLRRAALIVLDGWGYAPTGPGNAIALAHTPVWDRLWETYPHVLLEAAGEAVGLPDGVMGNSEVGHLTLGSGRVVYQDLSRINKAIADGSFFDNAPLRAVMDGAVGRGSALHLLGLVSDAGVHSSLEHLKALVYMARRQGVPRVFVHAFTDGRDTAPDSGKGYLGQLVTFLEEVGLGSVATVTGRYYAMDRDRRWDRVKLAYDALVLNEGLRAPNAVTAVEESYARGNTDEFILPTIIGDGAASRIASGDAVLFFNFRPDRARELSAALTQQSFDGFDRAYRPADIDFVGLTEYDPDLDLKVAFPKVEPRKVLAEVISEAGLRQLHIAETEKYAHVTFFFNGGREDPFPGEERVLVASPSDVTTYDQKPEMSAYEIVEALERKAREWAPDFTILNFANPDMVGHTGNLEATVAAVEHVDRCLGRALHVFRDLQAKVIIVADHGNAESMVAGNGSVNTAHTTGRVPLVILDACVRLREGAGLSDVAPTILYFLGLGVPAEMTGRSICEPRVGLE